MPPPPRIEISLTFLYVVHVVACMYVCVCVCACVFWCVMYTYVCALLPCLQSNVPLDVQEADKSMAVVSYTTPDPEVGLVV